MIKAISCTAGATRVKSSNSICPRGELLTIQVSVVTAAGAPVDLTGESIVLGWDTDAGTTPKPQALRESGDSTGIVEFEIETLDLAAEQYAFDVWRENDVHARTLLVERSFVRMMQPVAELNIQPTITMESLAASVPTGALALSGTASDADGTLTGSSITITVNGVAQAVTVTLLAGAWSATVTLATTGAKTIVATVTDAHGLTASATRTTTAV